MKTYIALLRGINVGGKNKLLMKDLISILSGMGYEDIRTYIQSGNVVFRNKEEQQAGKMAEDISSLIMENHGFKPEVLVLELSELREAIKSNPFSVDDGKALHFFFLGSEPENPDMERLFSLRSDSEEFRLCKKVFYLYAPDGIGRSKLAAKVEQSLRVPVTARNLNTVSKLFSMAGQDI